MPIPLRFISGDLVQLKPGRTGSFEGVPKDETPIIRGRLMVDAIDRTENTIRLVEVEGQARFPRGWAKADDFDLVVSAFEPEPEPEPPTSYRVALPTKEHAAAISDALRVAAASSVKLLEAQEEHATAVEALAKAYAAAAATGRALVEESRP